MGNIIGKRVAQERPGWREQLGGIYPSWIEEEEEEEEEDDDDDDDDDDEMHPPIVVAIWERQSA
jgi:hypothetical protein